jgi:hypothetical protein
LQSCVDVLIEKHTVNLKGSEEKQEELEKFIDDIRLNYMDRISIQYDEKFDAKDQRAKNSLINQANKKKII